MPVLGNAPASSQGAGGGAVPFIAASNHYREKMFQDSFVLGASTQEFVHNITPGGFLRGVRLFATVTGGTAATAPTADNPWNIFQSISLENIDGSPITYPMSGYSYYLNAKYNRPYWGDPAKRSTYVQSINPACELFIAPELRDTAGVLANTDARAQYRIRYTINTEAAIATGAYTLHGTVTVIGFMEAWSQPDGHDLHGNSTQGLPDGLGIATILRHQTLTLNNAGAANTLQIANTGNELRSLILVVRDSLNARQDYLSDPIRVRLDSKSLEVTSPNEVIATMFDFYDILSNGTSSREVGVYVFPRFRRPGDMVGQYWLGTNNATYLLIESTTLTGAVNLPGTIEVISSEVIPVGAVPPELEGC